MRKFVKAMITGEGNKIVYILFRPVLFVLSFLYYLVILHINFCYRIKLLKSVKLPRAKVISVGNITWGGTGKTSVVMLLSNYLHSRNKKIAVLIRGYGQDEDKMLKEKLRGIFVLSGQDRIRNAVNAQKVQHIDAFILDDGFQHKRIARDIDIVVVNASNPFGNRMLIPAGILREPISSLNRADIILLNKTNLADKNIIDDINKEIKRFAPSASVFEAEYVPVSLTEVNTLKQADVHYLKGKRLCAVVSVGDNESFFKMLASLGAVTASRFSFTDHHRYTACDIRAIISAAEASDCAAIITTAKDWVRLKPHFDKNKYGESEVLLLNSAVRINDEERFFRRIYSLFNS